MMRWDQLLSLDPVAGFPTWDNFNYNKGVRGWGRGEQSILMTTCAVRSLKFWIYYTTHTDYSNLSTRIRI
jgi:hypothetical protein